MQRTEIGVVCEFEMATHFVVTKAAIDRSVSSKDLQQSSPYSPSVFALILSFANLPIGWESDVLRLPGFRIEGEEKPATV
jgi:hypothetical protein